MLAALLEAWAALVRRFTFGRPNYLFVSVARPGKPGVLLLVPILTVRAVLEDACWLAAGLRFFPGIKKRMKVPDLMWNSWAQGVSAIPDLLRFNRSFVLLHLRDGAMQVSVSVL